MILEDSRNKFLELRTKISNLLKRKLKSNNYISISPTLLSQHYNIFNLI